MKALVLSDLHMEFHFDGGAGFVASLPDADMVILAGDISSGAQIPDALGLFAKKYSSVVFVPGNHEYYHSSVKKVERYLSDASEKHTNLIVLNNQTWETDSFRIHGGTLWFPEPKNARFKGFMNDFSLISGFEPWVYKQNAEAIHFFNRAVKGGDIVVTHHLPSELSVAPQFEGSALNHFFCSPVDDIIKKNKPKLWVHGHTHSSCDYMLDSTRVVCNPFGYARHQVNRDFDDHLFVEI